MAAAGVKLGLTDADAAAAGATANGDRATRLLEEFEGFADGIAAQGDQPGRDDACGNHHVGSRRILWILWPAKERPLPSRRGQELSK